MVLVISHVAIYKFRFESASAALAPSSELSGSGSSTIVYYHKKYSYSPDFNCFGLLDSLGLAA